MFKNILVANRGEIACRILKTAQEMKIDTHVLYHHADRNTPQVRMAKYAHELEAEVPVSAYLDMEQILQIAERFEIESIHPGYGFLSENSAFCYAVEKVGINYIGPTPESIQLLGDKITSRRTALEADVPVAPSVQFDGDKEQFIQTCKEMGFPLLIKASAGGGGKGMHVVTNADELTEKLETSSSEAERYFGDSRVYAEIYISESRHIEVQILGDGTGNVIHLFERECSIQRRFQKIIEESPAPNLNSALRDRICAAACSLARKVNYRNAGTVEFIVSGNNSFYFLEMNTRLQVEHPVTELVCDLDLVREQITIAHTGSLSFSQEEISQTGHAIESRICCENPANNFMPVTGKIEKLHLPDLEGVRYDLGFIEGQTITSDFDSMIGKLICYATDRPTAIKKCTQVIEELLILGTETNLNFLLSIFKNKEFLSEKTNTAFISDHFSTLTDIDLNEKESVAAVIFAVLEDPSVKRLIKDAPALHSFIGSWRN